MAELPNSKSAHLVGVCGAGMSALAEILLDKGWLISGSDLTIPNSRMQRIIKRGLMFHQFHSPENVPFGVQYLIHSPAISRENAERIVAAQRGLPQFSYSQMVALLMQPFSPSDLSFAETHSESGTPTRINIDRDEFAFLTKDGQGSAGIPNAKISNSGLSQGGTGVCIAGTHGKSTTTAMTARILEQAGRLSAAVLGAELCDNGRSGWSGSGDLFVVESCEYQQSFLDFHPKYAAILTVEPDHFDCYPNFDGLLTAFRDFASQSSADGILLVNGDCDASVSISQSAATSAKRVSFGTTPTADWMARNIKRTATGSTFQLIHHGYVIETIELPIPGLHNVMNALAAAAFSMEIGVPIDSVRLGLSQFHGIRRRLEFIGEWNGITLIDDYAHHPTAVKTTLETIRTLAGDRRVICVFQPHQVLRTRVLMDEFSKSFASASEVIVAAAYAARETGGDEPCEVSRELADRISQQGIRARFGDSLDQIATTLEDAMRPRDVIVTMGAGDIDRIHHELTRRIPRNHST